MSQPQLHISKEGDRYLRTMLVQGAHYILGPFGEDSDLRRWGLRLAGGGGKNAKKRAVVAVARKLAVLLHKLWVSREVYKPDPVNRCAKRANRKLGVLAHHLCGVEVLRGGLGAAYPLADPFVCRCLTSWTVLPSSHPAHRTGRAERPHPALGESVTMSPTGNCACAQEGGRDTLCLTQGDNPSSSNHFATPYSSMPSNVWPPTPAAPPLALQHS